MEAFAAPLLNPEWPAPPGLKTWNGSDPAARYAVYRNNVMVSLVDALAASFPVVLQLVGEPLFRAMAREHARRQPPESPVLAHYGEAFADFIDHFEAADSLPYLASVARLEWAYVSAFHAADAPSLPPQALHELLSRPEHLAAARLSFAPAVSLVRSKHPLVSIWRAHQEDGDFSGIDLRQAEAALIVRPALEVQVIPLSLPSADFLAELMAGRRLAAAYEQCAAEGAPDLAGIFSLLLQTHALSALET